MYKLRMDRESEVKVWGSSGFRSWAFIIFLFLLSTFHLIWSSQSILNADDNSYCLFSTELV